jgi:hypothetical protein
MENFFVICFGAIFYIGGPLLLFYGIYYLYLYIRYPKRSEESKNWPTTEAKLTSVHLLGRKGLINNIDLRYEYSIGGQEYVGKNLSLFPNTIFGKERLEEVLDTYHQGQYVTVYTNPGKPKEALIEHEVGEQGKFFLIWSIVNIVVGVFLVSVLVFGFITG